MKTKKRTTKFKGKLLHVVVEKQKIPNGQTKKVEKIIHPGAALIVPFLRKDTIVMIRQYRPVIKKYIYELPAGTLDAGERHLSCARRELIEEIGYSSGGIKKIGEIYTVPGYSTEKIVIYKAWDLAEAFLQKDVDEIIKAVPLKVSRIKDMLGQNSIKDAKTIAALAMCGICCKHGVKGQGAHLSGNRQVQTFSGIPLPRSRSQAHKRERKTIGFLYNISRLTVV